MYGSTNITEEDAKRMDSNSEDAEKLEAFESHIARGEKIEPGDWMPVEYASRDLDFWCGAVFFSRFSVDARSRREFGGGFLRVFVGGRRAS